MRVTDGMLSGSVVNNLQSVQQQLLQSESTLASGMRIQKPSDDPAGTAVALRLQAQIDGMQQYQANISTGQAWLQSTSTALNDAVSLVQQARSLVVQGASGSNPQSALNDIATQVQQIQQGLLTAANTQYDGLYVFSGNQTSTPALSSSGVYQGDSGQRQVAIGAGASVTVNVTGSAAFTTLFQTMSNVVSDLQSGNIAGLSGTDLPAVDAGLNALLDQQAATGATQQRMTAATNQLTSLQTSTQQSLASVTNADMAQTIVDFQQQQQAFQLALGAAAKLIQPTLLDFLQ